jgi:hypothetical protein
MTQIYSAAIDCLLLSHILDTNNAFYNEIKHLSPQLQRTENECLHLLWQNYEFTNAWSCTSYSPQFVTGSTCTKIALPSSGLNSILLAVMLVNPDSEVINLCDGPPKKWIPIPVKIKTSPCSIASRIHPSSPCRFIILVTPEV